MQRIWGNIVLNSAARIYALGAAFLLLLLTSRWLGPDGRGIVATSTTWVLLFSTVGFLSLGQVLLHHVTGRQDRNWLGSALGSLFLLTLVMTGFGWSIAALCYVISDGRVFGGIPAPLLAFSFLSLPLLIWEQHASYLLMAVEQVRYYNRAQVIGRTIGIAALALLVIQFGWGVWGALASLLISQALVAAGGAGYLISKATTPIRPEISMLKVLLSGCIKLHPNAIGTFLFSGSAVLILNYHQGADQAGFYQLSSQLVGLLLIIPQAASMSLYSMVTQLGPDQAWPAQRKLLLAITVLVTCISLIAGGMAPYLIPLVLGPGFEPTIQLFQLLLLTVPGMTISTLMASQWIGRGLFVLTSVTTVVIGGINLLLNVLLIPTYGTFGAVLATICTFIVGIIGNGIFALIIEKNLRQRPLGANGSV